jgi:hypothetical protein
VLIVVFAGPAGTSNTIGGNVGFRAGWGLGNALFIATSLVVIVASASGGFAGAIILYETQYRSFVFWHSELLHLPSLSAWELAVGWLAATTGSTWLSSAARNSSGWVKAQK